MCVHFFAAIDDDIHAREQVHVDDGNMTLFGDDQDGAGFMDAAPAGLHDEDIDAAGELFNDFSDSSSFSSRQYGDDDNDDTSEHHRDQLDWRFTIEDESGSLAAAPGYPDPQSSSVQLPPMLPQGAGVHSPAAAADRQDASQTGQVTAAGSSTQRVQKRTRQGGRRVDAEEDEESARSRPKMRADVASVSSTNRNRSAACEGWQWHSSIPSDLGVMTYESSDITLSHEIVAALLQSDEHTLSGPRPSFLTGPAAAAKGKIFKDDCRRRDRGTDRYKFKGGANNSACSPVLATTATGEDVMVKRSYGSVFTRRLTYAEGAEEGGVRGRGRGSRDGESGEHEQDGSLKVHQYCFEVKGKDLWPRIFHVQPQELATDEMEATVRSGAAATAKSTSARTSTDRQSDGKSRGRAQQAGMGDIKTKRGGNNGGRRHGGGKDGGAQHVQRLPNALGDVMRPLQLLNTGEQSPWITFHHHKSGEQMGAIQPSPDGRGINLKSRAGDFAEWHPRAPGQVEFEAGDLVALGPHGLTRETKGARQLGIISRQMVVAGSVPETAEEQALGDTVAYTGRVMLKVRGKCSAGDHLVPSSLQDGTAIANYSRGGASVGRALMSVPSLEDGTEIQMVECSVVGPASTVNEDEAPVRICCCSGCLQPDSKCFMGSSTKPQLLLVCFCGLLLVIGSVLLTQLSAGANKQLCSVLHSPAHMKISGQCDGTRGSCCTYQGCDEGFDMRSSAAPLTALTAGTIVSRKCTAAGRYDGEAMICVRRQCPPTPFNCSKAGSCCVGCGGDIQVAFPATPTPTACGGQDLSCLDSLPDVVTMECPASTHYGHLGRRCLSNGQWETSVQGICTRKTCSSITHHLDGYDMFKLIGAPAASAQFKASVTFPEVTEGTGALTLSCPSPQYQGSLTMTCANGSTQWTGLEGRCEWQHCSAQRFSTGLVKTERVKPVGAHEAVASSQLPQFVMQLPNLTVGESLHISCCSSFTPGGGCAEPTDGIGEVLASCSFDREYTVSGRCEKPDDIGVSLSAMPTGAGMTNHTENISAERLSETYQTLLTAVGKEVSINTAGAFALPPTGVLGALNMRRGSEWRPVVTASASWNHKGTIDTEAHNAAAGSRAVALGNVACRQMGFGGAVLVTNCRGLRLLRDHTSTSAGKALDQAYHSIGCSDNEKSEDGNGWDGGSKASETSKSPTWKAWIAYQSSTDNPTSATLHGQWLPGTNHSFHGPPPWLAHTGWTESFCVGNEAPVAPVGVASDPCEITLEPATAISAATLRLGICAKSAGAVAHCYREQLTRHSGGVVSDLSDLGHQLVVACSGTGTGAGKQLDQSGAGSGTWLVGDGEPGTSMAHNDLAAPKIFANTMPHIISQSPVDSKWFDVNRNVTSWGELSAAAVWHAGYFDGAWGDGSLELGKGQYSWSDDGMYCPDILVETFPLPSSY
eukprot:COSAG02_NODE_2969_length_7640_cov_2.657870_2_plen_1434_part_00